MSRQKTLMAIYKKLYSTFGPQHWWPADSDFEVIVGAILTQNAAWSNVEKAIVNLKRRRLLKADSLYKISHKRLASLIRPAGYFNIKARRLKSFLKFLFDEYGGSLKKMFLADTHTLRAQLLAVNGIGPETADSILLYAAGRPVFVVDAYTKRIFSRHKLIEKDADYGRIQSFFMKNIPERRDLYNEYHALIVELGKNICRPKAQCDICPLKGV